MRIACPDCNAAYDVPPDRVPPGRAVKCARCGVTWTPVATMDAAPEIAPLPDRKVAAITAVAPNPDPEPPPATVPRPPPEALPDLAPPPSIPPPPLVSEPPPTPRSRAPVLLAWLATFAILGALGWATIRYRTPITQAWPPSERVYALLGLHPAKPH